MLVWLLASPKINWFYRFTIYTINVRFRMIQTTNSETWGGVVTYDAFQYFTWMYMTIPPLDDSGWFVSLQALYRIYSPQAST